jgi:riboflavin synthase
MIKLCFSVGGIMYSGITSGLFQVIFVEKKPELVTYTVRFSPELSLGLTLGSSVAIDGVCQTVVGINHTDITFDAIKETLNCTTLNTLFVGRWVSVERSLRYGDEIGGHEVAGHVIGTASIVAKNFIENSLVLTVKCPQAWMKFILPKGFIAVDGSSLTVGEVDVKEGTFKLNLIPETLRLTSFPKKNVGDWVNIELDHRTQAIVMTVERVLRERANMLD